MAAVVKPMTIGASSGSDNLHEEIVELRTHLTVDAIHKAMAASKTSQQH